MSNKHDHNINYTKTGFAGGDAAKLLSSKLIYLLLDASETEKPSTYKRGVKKRRLYQ